LKRTRFSQPNSIGNSQAALALITGLVSNPNLIEEGHFNDLKGIEGVLA